MTQKENIYLKDLLDRLLECFWIDSYNELQWSFQEDVSIDEHDKKLAEDLKEYIQLNNVNIDNYYKSK